MLKGTDAYVFIPGPLLAAYQRRINPQLMSDELRYSESGYDVAKKANPKGARLTFGYIGEEMAGIMGRTVQQVEERQLSAALVNFEQISRSARKLSSSLTDGSEVYVTAGGSRLESTLRGETTIEDGVVSPQDMKAGDNMTYVPPGFVSKGVDPASASGTLTVSKSVTRLGVLNDAKLTFKERRLLEWSSKTSMPRVTELINS